MDDPPYLHSLPAKAGLTKEEQRKVTAFLKVHKITVCPAMGTPELAALIKEKCRKIMLELTPSMQKKLGLALKPKKSKEQKRKERNEYQRQYYWKDPEKVRAYYRKEAQHKRGAKKTDEKGGSEEG